MEGRKSEKDRGQVIKSEAEGGGKVSVGAKAQGVASRTCIRASRKSRVRRGRPGKAESLSELEWAGIGGE